MALIDNIKRYYKCEDNAANTTVIDAVGANNATASTNTSNLSVVGLIDDGFNLTSGSSESINSGSTQADAAFSVSMWFKTSETSTWQTLFGNSDSGTNGGMYILGRGNAGGKIHIYIRNVNTVTLNNVTWSEGTTVHDGAWHHMVLTFNGTDDWNMYIDNNNMTLSDSTGTMTASADNLEFGHSATNNYWNGDLDEIGWWDKVLTQGEVTELYNSGNGLAYPFVAGTNMQINIGDAWKDISSLQINIGDVWKSVSKVELNVGDTWKTIF